MLSVLIATHNRPQSVCSCLCAFQKSTERDFEIIVMDQSTNGKTRSIVEAFHDARFIYKHMKQRGKSSALNHAMKIARGSIYCFTDDDCIIDTRWLQRIQNGFTKHRSVDGIVGTSVPYQPKRHPDEICLSTFRQNKYKIITHPQNHAVYIGFGNNMAWKKQACNNVFFSTHLGPHSVGKAAEDADFMLRQLMFGKHIACDPKCIVRHNNWVDKNTKLERDLTYIHGEMVCYTHFALLGWKFAQRIILDNFLDSFGEIKKNLGDVVKRKTIRLDSWRHAIAKLLIRMKGLCVGIAYSSKKQ